MQQKSKEWFELRKTKIGSSDAATIFFGTEKEKLALWEKKKGLREEEPINEFMQRGIDLEDDARNWASNQLDCFLLPDVKVSDEFPWMMSSIDGIHEDIAVEIKCPTFRGSLEKAQSGEYDQKHYIQMQHHMAVWDIYKIYYVIYFSEVDAHIFEIERDQNIIDLLIAREQLFYEWMLSEEPPIKKRIDTEWVRAETEYLIALEEQKIAEKKVESAKEKLLILCDHSFAMGDNLTISKYMRKGTVNYSKIPELKSIDLDQYRGEDKVCFRFTAKK